MAAAKRGRPTNAERAARDPEFARELAAREHAKKFPPPAPISPERAAVIAQRGIRATDLDPTKLENKRIVRDIFEEFGEERISEALLFAASGNEESPAYSLWARMHDPAWQGVISKAGMMKEAGVTHADLLMMLRSRDIAIGLADSGKHIAGILEDMGEESRSRFVRCEHCDEAERSARELAAKGIDVGELPECAYCGGSGMLRQVGSAEARKLFLEVHGLRKTGSGGGNVVNVGVQVNPEKSKAPEPVTVRVQKILDGQIADDGIPEAEIVEGSDRGGSE